MNVSKINKRGLLYTQTGTPYYASPEVWNDKPYDSKSDIWSLGCVIYEMASLRPPFRAEDMEGLYKAVTDGQFKKLPSHFSVDLNNLIKNMLKVNPASRPSAEKLLSSPLITKRLDQKLMIDSDELDQNMLKTILLPNNILQLSDRLPNANYDPIKTKLSAQFTKSTLVHLGDSSSKIGLEDQKEILDNIRGKNASRSSSEKKRQNGGHNIMERIFNDNPTSTPQNLSSNPNQSKPGQSQLRGLARERNGSESLPVLKKPLMVEIDR